jgi:dihydroorotate dehydrogenase (NAD+) catalytic subunit
MHKSLSIEIAGLKLENPTMLAAGVLGMTALSLKHVADAGVGALVTKSIGLHSRVGYANPTVTQTPCGLLNAMGLPNPGVEEFSREIHELKTLTNVPVIASVFGFSIEEYVKVSELLVASGVDAIELNVSCPHVEKTGCEIGQDPELLHGVVSNVKSRINKPVFVKLSPNVADIAALAKTVVDAGADAVTAINTVRAMAINIETGMPILANRFGGLSGPAIKPIAIRCVYEIYKAVDVPIIGCGGVTTWRDAVEYFLAGASAVQIGTAVAFKGLSIFKSVVKGIEAYIEEKGYRGVEDLVGLSHNV